MWLRILAGAVGHGRGRWLRGLGGHRRWQRPRRARCRASGRTVVLLADWSLGRPMDPTHLPALNSDSASEAKVGQVK